jgi:hypothetical protein
VAEDGLSFKIGISNDVKSRIAQLRSVWGELDLESSFEFSAPATRMKSVEKMLHFLFSEYNLEHEESKDGYTEWFDIACFDSVIEQIRSIEELKSEEFVVTRDLSRFKSDYSKVTTQTSESRHLDLYERNIERNKASLAAFNLAIESLKDSEIKYVPADDINDGELTVSSINSDIRQEIKALCSSAEIYSHGLTMSTFPSCSGTIEAGKKSFFIIKVQELPLREVADNDDVNELASAVLNFLISHTV